MTRLLLLLLTLLFSLSGPVIGELSDFERSSLAAKTTAFPKPPVPSGPKPPKMSELLEFGSGKDVPGLQRTFSREYLEQNGITREVAEQWRDVYRWQVENMPKNPAAPGRLDLMERVIETLSGG